MSNSLLYLGLASGPDHQSPGWAHAEGALGHLAGQRPEACLLCNGDCHCDEIRCDKRTPHTCCAPSSGEKKELCHQPDPGPRDPKPQPYGGLGDVESFSSNLNVSDGLTIHPCCYRKRDRATSSYSSASRRTAFDCLEQRHHRSITAAYHVALHTLQLLLNYVHPNLPGSSFRPSSSKQ
jgi:hypothetical protein